MSKHDDRLYRAEIASRINQMKQEIEFLVGLYTEQEGALNQISDRIAALRRTIQYDQESAPKLPPRK